MWWRELEKQEPPQGREASAGRADSADEALDLTIVASEAGGCTFGTMGFLGRATLLALQLWCMGFGMFSRAKRDQKS